MKNMNKGQNGITLIALVVTIIVLLILAGISISMLTGQNGILKRTAEAKEKTKQSQAEELSALSELENQMNNYQDDGFDTRKGVNRPQLTSGMTRIMYEEPENGKNGKVIKDGETGFSTDWYDYGSKKWANVMTKDGSMWVWIPRYAYKLDKANKTIDVIFLVGTSNKWYDPDTKQNEELPEGYKVHPCFQSGKSDNYKNGEWKEEIRGIWVAKFEAGLPDDAKASQANITGMEKPYYPVFQGQKGSYNYITVSECYLLSKALTDANNPYGLTSSADSHLIKNSEWGAAAYLSYSNYGKGKDTEVFINNVSYGVWGESSLKTSIREKNIYAITGYSASIKDDGQNILTSVALGDEVTGATKTSYAWHTINGIKASSTGNIYGMYDMSGGAAEYTSTYVNVKTNSNLLDHMKSYGTGFAYKNGAVVEENTPYTMIYPEYTEGTLLEKIADIYGDAMNETPGWNDDWRNNNVSGPFFTRGSNWDNGSIAGVFAFDDDLGYDGHYKRFPQCACS